MNAKTLVERLRMVADDKPSRMTAAACIETEAAAAIEARDRLIDDLLEWNASISVDDPKWLKKPHIEDIIARAAALRKEGK